MSIDIGDTIAPNSDQLDAVDLLTGPRTFTIQKVSKGNAEQPVNVHLAEFPRVWRPGKSMRRVLVAAWGSDAALYVGRRLTLWCDPTVRFGGAAIGGTRITHLSDIAKDIAVPLLVTRGKSEMYTVKKLSEKAEPTPIVSAETLDELYALFVRKGIGEDRQLAGVNAITGGSATELETITEKDARRVIDALGQRADA